MKALQILVLFTLVATTAACGLEGITSGQIGCPASEITITDDRAGFNEREWTAQCHERTYYCSAAGGGRSSSISCKESSDASGSEASTSAKAAGCTYDTQCKGDRVCKAGQCVEPGS